jgi:aspartyl-tRNA(Asn)/glutamyl-tRNA(Gln) amidotransferase subunit A
MGNLPKFSAHLLWRTGSPEQPNGRRRMSQLETPKELVRDPGRIAQLARAIADRHLSPVDLVRGYLSRIEAAEPHVKAWVLVDDKRALVAAEQRHGEAQKGQIRGPLHGIPVGIKDIIDVEGLPTRCNSKSRAGTAAATCDAEIVLALKAQGAIVLGKVHTTEFAFFDPSPACNPYNVEYTPGGSSSGSAAAVAAGMVPLTVGTQTVASVNRPAAYCGIAAFKPSTGSLSTFGIAPLGPSYDTPGLFGWSVADAVYAYQAIAPDHAGSAAATRKLPNIALLDDPHIHDAIPEMKGAVTAMCERLATAGARIEIRASPIAFKRLFEIQRSTMLYEASRAMRSFLDLPEGQIGEKLKGAIVDGLAISEQRYLDERREIGAMRRSFLAETSDLDAFLWPATPGPAPKSLTWTGDPKYIAPWTALGGPMITVPAGFTADGLPLGCILIGKIGADHALCALAQRSESALCV